MDGIDRGIAGTDWTDAENDLLVDDYFAMLGKELAGEPYVKADHRRQIVERTGRSEGSVERKYMNVSAVLDHLGLPRIRGYAPAEHAHSMGLPRRSIGTCLQTPPSQRSTPDSRIGGRRQSIR